MTKLVIAEKPSVARDIARVLKCNKKGQGYLFNDNYIISWAIGHLVTLCDPEDYDKGLKKWDMSKLPIIPEQMRIKAYPNTVQQFELLKAMLLSDKVESVICATDSGREGELIFRYIYELAGCNKPFERLWISSMTDAAIKAGFDKLKPGRDYDNLYNSAKCRSEADWLVGINATRAFTIKYNNLLSVGRVQTPTLAIIVQRQKEIEAFKVSEYWEVNAEFESSTGSYKAVWFNEADKESKIDKKEKADEIVAKCKGKSGVVESVQQEQKKNAPPLLYDLTELQRDANKKFGFSAQKTLDIAQALYEKHKMITYPRTDSRYLSDDMVPKLGIILNKLRSIAPYVPFIDALLSSQLHITSRIVDNSKISDHHAIIPTEINPRINALNDEQGKVYDLIARRFIQVFMPYYVYNTTKIITAIDTEKFSTTGTTVVEKGWTELEVSAKKEKKKELLPDVKMGDEVKTKSVKAVSKKTKPPTPYNEAGLLSAMENAGRFVDDEELKEQLKESGLGTPATRAGIIERLLQVKYIERKGKNIVPTEKGVKLISIVPEELRSPETTGKWEKALTSIAKGSMNTEQFMDSIKKYVGYIITEANKEGKPVLFAADKPRGKKAKAAVLGICPNCKGHILENSRGYFCSNWKQGCKFTIWKNALDNYGLTVDTQMAKKLLENSVEPITLYQNGTNEKYSCQLSLSSDNSGKIDVKLDKM